MAEVVEALAIHK